MDDKKNIEIVSGDGSNLDISPVYDHFNSSTPKSSQNKPKNIVVPKELKKSDENKKTKDKDKK